MPPKIAGTWNLHTHLPSLDFFVLLSSIAGVCGAVSQSSYAGASIFQDAFARHRHSLGQHCVSLDLGIVQDVGYVAERVDVARFLALSMADHKVLSEADMQFMVGYACSPHIRIGDPWHTQLIGALTTPSFVERHGKKDEHAWMRMRVFGGMYHMERGDETGKIAAPAEADSLESRLGTSSSLAEATGVIAQALASRLARALAVPVEDIDTDMPPFTFGVDSLVAVELMFWFSNEARADVPVVQILGNASVKKLAGYAAGISGYVDAGLREEGRGGKQ
jgi:acyl carrier protein